MPPWARGKKEKYYELRDGSMGEQGQDKEAYSNLPLIGTVLECSTSHTPKRPNPKKKNPQTEGKKSVFERGWSGRKKKTGGSWDRPNFWPIM